MKYIFYSKKDSSKEVISKVNAESLEAASNKFATTKRLSLPIFLKLFTVEEDEGNKRST